MEDSCNDVTGFGLVVNNLLYFVQKSERAYTFHAALHLENYAFLEIIPLGQVH
jgi:hypothetical protein